MLMKIPGRRLRGWRARERVPRLIAIAAAAAGGNLIWPRARAREKVPGKCLRAAPCVLIRREFAAAESEADPLCSCAG